MSLILNKYKNKRKLGKGAYGEVLLVEDQMGAQYALKLISLKSLQKESYLIDYLEGEIECMQSMHSPYIMRLIDSFEDDKYKYMLCEYCDGGDLLNLQAKQPGQVFTLDRAVEILAHVIHGLELLHREDYLHRDIKSQNILIKTENGKQMFKLADFGFSKKSADVGGTVLGTENYMSPEIYRSDNYGFQVDMWAFAVLFFFMLNKQFPFKVNPHFEIERKEAQLNKQAKNFSYKKAVENTKKKLIQNCSEDTEDLFRKMFNIKADERINFHHIREHPVFKKHFPVIEEASKILYAKKFQSKVVAKAKLESKIVMMKKQEKKKKKPVYEDLEDDMPVSLSYMKKKNIQFPKEKSIIENKTDELNFLFESGMEFIGADFLNTAEKMNLGFNITKYYIILMRQFLQQMNPEKLTQKYPNLKWKDYCKTQQFLGLKDNLKESLNQAEMKFDMVYGECEHLLPEIIQINPKFKYSFDRDISQTDFKEAFKESYRKSTHYTFNTLRECLKTNKKGGTKLNYALAILVICHVFNHIFKDNKNMETIFADYIQQNNRKVEDVDFSELREWMTKASGQKLNYIAKNIIKIYFST